MMRRTLFTIAVAGLVVACTAIVSTDPVQCKNDGDCTKRGPDFVDTVCDNGLCAPSAAQADAAPAGECAKNSDCAGKGEGLVCASHTLECVKLESDDCKVVYGDGAADGTILYGLLSEIGPEDTNYFRQQQHVSAAKLAFAEFFERAGASFPGGAKGALVACSEHFPRKVSAHLANLGVKAVIGPSAEDRQRAVVETLLPARVPSFTPWINGNPGSVVPGSAGFAWLAAFQRADVVAPLNALVAEREAHLRSQGKTKVRVAVVVNEPNPTEAGVPFNAYAEYGDIMDQRLVFNGKTAVENQSDPTCDGNACYKRFATNQAVLATVNERADAIVAFKPDLVVPFTDIDWGAQLLPALEARFAALPVAERPTYVQPFLQIEDAGYKELDVADASLRARITGIRPLRDNSFELFANKFRAAYTSPSDTTKQGPPPNPGAGRAFETSLLLLLTTYAALAEKPNATPEEIVAALPIVTDPNGTRVTLNDLVTGVGALNAKARINFDGLFTFFDLDMSTHSAPATWTTWCLGPSRTYDSTNRIFRNNTFDGPPDVCP
ncbi:MAG: hypothetical protein KIT84_05175 [Labilithrix sp.]|nr:hypothetical protein [Labilithrix sp.]MCW5810378.1 hypothetical protein [Labilithrix sp.]